MSLSLEEREYRLRLLKEKGYTYDCSTGIIKNKFGKLVSAKNNSGYIVVSYKKNKSCLLIRGHHFAWYMIYNKTPFHQIDHINGIRYDNRIENLREVNNQQNHFNETSAKGYHWDKNRLKWKSEIMLDNKNIYLGRFNSEIEARNAYLEAKIKYHKIY